MAPADAPISVLLVEDEPMISSMVAEELSEHGFDVHQVSTGDAALRYIKSGERVDVMFTDVNLPGGIDGTELAIRMRDMRPDLPIVYASGRYIASGLGKMVSRSVFVPKPYLPQDVCMLLSRLTDAH